MDNCMMQIVWQISWSGNGLKSCSRCKHSWDTNDSWLELVAGSLWILKASDIVVPPAKFLWSRHRTDTRFQIRFSLSFHMMSLFDAQALGHTQCRWIGPERSQSAPTSKSSPAIQIRATKSVPRIIWSRGRKSFSRICDNICSKEKKWDVKGGMLGKIWWCLVRKWHGFKVKKSETWESAWTEETSTFCYNVGLFAKTATALRQRGGPLISNLHHLECVLFDAVEIHEDYAGS